MFGCGICERNQVLLVFLQRNRVNASLGNDGHGPKPQMLVREIEFALNRTGLGVRNTLSGRVSCHDDPACNLGLRYGESERSILRSIGESILGTQMQMTISRKQADPRIKRDKAVRGINKVQ